MTISSEILTVLKDLHLLTKTSFVILYGSQSKGKETPLSDVDICISLSLPASQKLKTRIKILGKLSEKYDVHFFEDLPLYVKKRVLAGKILYVKDQKKLVNEALEVIRDYEDFEPVYLNYIGETAYG